MEDSPGEKEKEEKREEIHYINQQTETMMGNMKHDKDQEMTLSEVETEDHELQDILEREHLDLEKFLEQGTTEGMHSLPQEEFNTLQQLFLWRTQTKGSRGKRNLESQDNKVVKTMKTTSGLAPSNPGRKRGRKKQNKLLIECGKLMIDLGKMKDLSSYYCTNISE